MLHKQTYKIVGTLSVLVFLSLGNGFAQNITPNKGDSTIFAPQTVVSVKNILPTNTDSLVKKSPIVTAVQSPLIGQKDAPIAVVPTSPIVVEDDKDVFKIVEEQPEFTGGLSAFFKYLSNNLKTPVEALKERVEGRVFLSFVVNVDSTIANVTVLRTAFIKRTADDKTVEVDAEKDKIAIDALKNEAMRVIKAMPKWKPGKQSGQIVRSLFTMPVRF